MSVPPIIEVLMRSQTLEIYPVGCLESAVIQRVAEPSNLYPIRRLLYPKIVSRVRCLKMVAHVGLHMAVVPSDG